MLKIIEKMIKDKSTICQLQLVVTYDGDSADG